MGVDDCGPIPLETMAERGSDDAGGLHLPSKNDGRDPIGRNAWLLRSLAPARRLPAAR